MHGAKTVPSASQSTEPTKSSPLATTTSPVTAAPVAPNTISEKVQSVITENNNLQLEQLKPKVVSIDKSSKKIVPTAAPENKLVLDSSVDIRNDETSFNAASRQSVRVP